MGKAIPFDYRKKIVKRIKQGEKAKNLAKEFGFSESGVKKIWYAYKKEGEKAYQTKYTNCGCHSIYDSSIRNTVAEVRDNMQGGAYVRSKLEQEYPDKQIPHERTLQRWWVQQGVNRQKGRPRDYEKKDGVKHPMKHGK